MDDSVDDFVAIIDELHLLTPKKNAIEKIYRAKKMVALTAAFGDETGQRALLEKFKPHRPGVEALSFEGRYLTQYKKELAIMQSKSFGKKEQIRDEIIVMAIYIAYK